MIKLLFFLLKGYVTYMDISTLTKLDVQKDLMGEDFHYDPDEHDKYTKEWFEDISFELNNIYLDLVLLKDIRLAAFLDVIKDEPDGLKYVREHIAIYDFRLHNDLVTESFTIYHEKYHEKYIEAINDQTQHPYYWKTAPHTFLVPLLEFICNICRKSAVMHDRIYNPNIYINTYPFHVDAYFLQLIKIQFQYIYPRINLFFLFKPYNKLPFSLLDSMDLFIIDDLVEFIKEDVSIHKSLFDYLAYDNKQITATKRLDLSLVEPDDTFETLQEKFYHTELFLKLLCQFEYFTPFILTDKDYEVDEYTQLSANHLHNLMTKTIRGAYPNIYKPTTVSTSLNQEVSL
jgi:hypothetical protein